MPLPSVSARPIQQLNLVSDYILLSTNIALHRISQSRLNRLKAFAYYFDLGRQCEPFTLLQPG